MVLLFSLAVGGHQPHYLKSRLLNILKMVPDSIIVINILENQRANLLPALHIFAQELFLGSRLIINPEIRRGNQFDVLLSNYRFAKQIGLQFDYVIFETMKSAIVKPGLAKYIEQYDFGLAPILQARIDSSPEMKVDPFFYFLKDLPALNWFKKRGITHIVKSQMEGTWYKRQVLDHLIGILDREFPHYPYHGAFWKTYGPTYTKYWVEEIFLSTLLFNGLAEEKGWKSGVPYVWINLADHLINFPLKVEFIRSVVNNKLEPQMINSVERTNYNTYALKKIYENTVDPCFQYVESLNY